MEGGGILIDLFRHFHPDEPNGMRVLALRARLYTSFVFHARSSIVQVGCSTLAAYTCWETMTNARETNYGARIDYILTTPDLVPDEPSVSAYRFVNCTLLRTVLGSDHCPVQGDLEGRRMRVKRRNSVRG